MSGGIDIGSIPIETFNYITYIIGKRKENTMDNKLYDFVNVLQKLNYTPTQIGEAVKSYQNDYDDIKTTNKYIIEKYKKLFEEKAPLEILYDIESNNHNHLKKTALILSMFVNKAKEKKEDLTIKFRFIVTNTGNKTDYEIFLENKTFAFDDDRTPIEEFLDYMQDVQDIYFFTDVDYDMYYIDNKFYVLFYNK